MKVYEQIKDMLCDELEDIVKQKELTPNTLEMLDTAIDIIKDLKEIEAMESEYPSAGYSREGGYSRGGGYSEGFYGRMPYYMYEGGNQGGSQGSSYARGRGSNSSRDSQRYYENGYSGDTKEELHRLMSAAKNDREREAIRAALDSMR